MSIRFAIKNNSDKATVESDGTIVRFSGTSEPFRRKDERASFKVGQDVKGNDIIKFITGLDESRVKFYPWYNEEEQKEVIKQIKEYRQNIIDFYGGPEVVDDKNIYFWKDNRDVNVLAITEQDIDIFYDTKSPAHALLYLSIISGAFIDLVAPTKQWADDHYTPHYLALETDHDYSDDSDMTKMDAMAALAELRKEESPDALFILAWCLQYDTNGYGAYGRNIPARDLIQYHINYINGKLVTKKKKDTAKEFLKYVEKWKGQQTRPQLYAEAYIKAGEYYNFIHSKDKKYTTAEGTVLGNTIQEAVTNVTKAKNSTDLETLRDKVEEKWKS